MAKIRKGDQVKILSGKDRGKTGAVSLVLSRGKATKVVVEGWNKIKKHQRARKQGQKGQIVSVERPISISSVQMVCKSCGKPARTGWRQEGDKKIRLCKKCLAAI